VGRDANAQTVGDYFLACVVIALLVTGDLVGEDDNVIVLHAEVGVPSSFGEQGMRQSFGQLVGTRAWHLEVEECPDFGLWVNRSGLGRTSELGQGRLGI